MGSEKRLTREYSLVASAITRLSVIVDDPSRGIQLFNSGHYWEAHEAWELEWTPDRKGPEAGFYKGLIQVAAGCLHYGRHNRRGAVNKWTSGAGYLRPYLPAHRGVRLAELVRSVDGFLAAMEAGVWPDLEMPTIVQE
jgi:predicted metal-dependent hydrolase